MSIISKEVLCFLVFYDRVSVVKYSIRVTDNQSSVTNLNDQSSHSDRAGTKAITSTTINIIATNEMT
jgi:hypothetical protein